MKKNILIISVILFGLLIASSVYFYKQEKIVLTVNNEKVSVDEFKIYLWLEKKDKEQKAGSDIWATTIDGKNTEEFLKEKALNEVIITKIQSQKAKQRNISLSEDEKQKLQSEIEKIEKQKNNISELKQIKNSPKIFTKVLTDIIMTQKLYKEVTKDFKSNVGEFNKYLEQNKQKASQDIEEVKKTYIDKQKNKLFDEKFQEWKKDSKIKVNNKVLKQIKI